MWRDALLVAGKDLRIEAALAGGAVAGAPVRAVVPRPVRLRPRTGPARPCGAAAPGLFWLAVLFSTVLATQRSFAIESGEGTRDGLRLSGIDPAGVFLGKAAAVAVQLWPCSSWCSGPASPCSSGCGSTPSGWPSSPRCWPRSGLVVRRRASTARCPPACGCARPCCRCWCCRSWRPVLLAGSRAWTAALTGAAASGAQWLRILGRLRRRLPRPRRRPLRTPPGGVRETVDWVRAVGVGGARSTAAATVVLGLWVTPPDQVQGDLVRLRLPPPADGLRGPLPGRRAGRALEPPVPVAPDPLVVLGPPGRRLGRGGGRLLAP